MNLQRYYEMQAELDAFVADNLGVNINGDEYVDKRIFALKVELAELANEVAFFKYWKQSHMIDKDATLEEWADVFHFFLSIGLSREYSTFVPEIKPEAWEQAEADWIFQQIMQLNYVSAGQWKSGLEMLVQLGFKLGFTESELESAYQHKWEKNFKRQQDKY